MKKLIFLFSVIAINPLFSQSISLEAHETNVDAICCNTLLGDIGTEITVKNISDASIEIKVSRKVISQTSGTENYFCWTSCYGSHISESPEAKIFSPLQEDTASFQVHFDNLGVTPSSATILYCAFDSNNPSDSACTVVYYSGPTSVNDNFTNSYFSDFHPNPSSSLTSLDYKLTNTDVAEVVVTNMLGTIIKKAEIKNVSGTLKFDVNDTPTGIYFANIIVNGELQSIKRLVVSR